MAPCEYIVGVTVITVVSGTTIVVETKVVVKSVVVASVDTVTTTVFKAIAVAISVKVLIQY